MNARPVVATGVGPVHETLGDTGLTVDAQSPEQMALACLGLLGTSAGQRSPGRRPGPCARPFHDGAVPLHPPQIYARAFATPHV